MEHTVKAFDEELNRLHSAIDQMGKRAAAQFELALAALKECDVGFAAKIVEGDDEIDQLQHVVDQRVITLLALRAPVADDLRLTVSALKIAGDLERIGDYAVNIAKRSIVLRECPAMRSAPSLTRVGRVALRLLIDVLDAYRDDDADKAVTVWMGDREVDELYATLFRELLTYMMEDPRSIATCAHLLFIAKHIERVGDLATNIGEMVHYKVTGRSIDGLRPKGEPAVAE